MVDATHSRGERHGRYLDDVGGLFAHHMTAEDLGRHPVDDKVGESSGVPVDHCAHRCAVVRHRGYDAVRFARLLFGEAHRGVFRVCETACGDQVICDRQLRAVDGVCGGHKTIPHGFGGKHDTARYVACRKDIWCGGLEIFIDL